VGMQPCPNCRRAIVKGPKSCPHCGASLATPLITNRRIVLFVCAFGVVVFGGLMIWVKVMDYQADSELKERYAENPKVVLSEIASMIDVHHQTGLARGKIAVLREEGDSPQLDELEKRAQIVQAEINATSSDDHVKHEALKTLVQMKPDDKQAKANLAVFEEDLAAIKAKGEADKAAFAKLVETFGRQPTKATVKTFLQQVANDPSSVSIENCTSVHHVKDGWAIGCDYRAKNGFGALVMKSNWFVVNHDRVKMLPKDAYRL
jgi:hypothetical protein